MDPGNLGDILNLLETQNELFMKAAESVKEELSTLMGEENMLMSKFYDVMSKHGYVKKPEELHEVLQKHGDEEVSADIGNSTASVTTTSNEEN